MVSVCNQIYTNWLLGSSVVNTQQNSSYVVTVLWLDSDDVVTVLSPTSGTSGRLQNRVSVPPWFLHIDCV